jgi:hypothetical protein
MARTCATMEHHNYLAQTDEVYQLNRRGIESFSSTARLVPRTAIVRIPVVVHVIYKDEQENLSAQQIDSQIAALNRDFRLQNPDRANIPEPFREFATDSLIEFALAVRDPDGQETSGVTRTRTSIDRFPYNDQDPRAIAKLDQLIKQDEFGKSPWPSSDYLNLWACMIGGSLLGYAQFPGGAPATDGVVITSTAFGVGPNVSTKFNMGRTAVHEVGHWLNLLHIWGDDRGGCTRSDNVHDTPNQADANTDKPRFPRVSCNNGPHGDMFMNYMDYVDDDTMVMFTKGQLERMNATLAGPRASLAESKGLLPVTTPRLAFGAEGQRAGANRPLAFGTEAGQPVQQMFDGVSWVPTT